jgi:hypothetical protein
VNPPDSIRAEHALALKKFVKYPATHEQLKYLRGLKLSFSEVLLDKEQWILMMKSDETSNGSGSDRRALVSCLALLPTLSGTPFAASAQV